MRQKRILVTGLTGFKGQWLGRWLKRLGAEVCGLGLAARRDPSGGAWDPAAEFDCRTIDVRDRAAVAGFLREVQPELVFHLAAQPLVRQSYHDPVATFATNVMGTVHVLEAARELSSVRAVINVTSDKCYENREWYWAYREDERLGGHDPYSASKGCAELVTSSYRRSFAQARGLQIATARGGNVIGGADWADDRLIPDIVRAVFLRQPVVVRNPFAIRPWQHVLEALSGYLLLGAGLLESNRALATAWNFGPADADAICVGEVARRVVERFGCGEVQLAEGEAGRLHEARYLKLDSSKARSELSWQPLLSMEERLNWTVDWYQQWSESPEQSGKLMDQQVELYESRLLAWLDRKQSSSRGLPVSSAPHLRAA
jgi:CDP-glucose 4,6-dehydratase